jgi:tetratricopeptide (TPR) repeat protein
LLRGPRQQLHARIGAVLEARFAEIVETQPQLLAHHCTEAGLIDKAITYLQVAGQQAAARAAHSEAAAHFGGALKLLETFPEDSDRISRELQLQMALAPALIQLKGYGSAEMAGAFARARELCRRLGDPPAVFPILCGVANTHLNRGELKEAKEKTEELVRMAAKTSDPAQLRRAHDLLAFTLFHRGELLLSMEHLDLALAIYDRARDEPLNASGVSPGVVHQSCRSWVLWHLGYPDRALETSNQARVLAQELGHRAVSLLHRDTRVTSVGSGGKLSRYGKLQLVISHCAPSMAWPAFWPRRIFIWARR